MSGEPEVVVDQFGTELDPEDGMPVFSRPGDPEHPAGEKGVLSRRRWLEATAPDREAAQKAALDELVASRKSSRSGKSSTPTRNKE